MVLTLFGNPQSGCTKRVATVLYEKQVPFTFVDVDLVKGEQFTPDHLEKQPFAKVPYIDDDGFILYESRAICRYIEKKYPDQGTKLIPTDPKAEALFEQAASIELCNFNPYATGAVYEALVKPRFLGQPTDPQAVASLLANLGRTSTCTRRYSLSKYLSGDAITLADLFHIPPAVALPATGSTAIESRPNVARLLLHLPPTRPPLHIPIGLPMPTSLVMCPLLLMLMCRVPTGVPIRPTPTGAGASASYGLLSYGLLPYPYPPHPSSYQSTPPQHNPISIPLIPKKNDDDVPHTHSAQPQHTSHAHHTPAAPPPHALQHAPPLQHTAHSQCTHTRPLLLHTTPLIVLALIFTLARIPDALDSSLHRPERRRASDATRYRAQSMRMSFHHSIISSCDLARNVHAFEPDPPSPTTSKRTSASGRIQVDSR
ncbi:hypothetical protein D9611_015111 [Ephemerocybe angulata]|uniref:glutathione transferase n=1 Tax=Ephemerocybe angulata TaxID=980116 RepID=A0A8H5BRC6_9AGAR|nr:hypothetical protein D9611_015111 [Tulosesus angulatus]